MIEPTITEIESEDMQETISKLVPAELSGQRLDRAAANLFPNYSRGRLQLWIDEGYLLVEGKSAGRRDTVIPGTTLSLQPQTEAQGEWLPQPIEIPVVYEDKDILVVDKPAGLVVHPGAGNQDGTLLNGLIYRDPSLVHVPRAGIVHRLDKDTTGLMVVARNLSAQNSLIQQLQARSVTRLYHAIALGGPTASGSIDEPIGRSPKNRLKMAVVKNGKEAITHYRILKKFRDYKLLEMKLETGRTHQIRVHLSHNKWPILGDPTYGGRSRLPKNCPRELKEVIENFGRQALHAVRLELDHPRTGENLSWDSSLPADMQQLLESLQNYGP